MKKLNVIFIFVGDPLNATAKMDVLKLGVDFNKFYEQLFHTKDFGKSKLHRKMLTLTTKI